MEIVISWDEGTEVVQRGGNGVVFEIEGSDTGVRLVAPLVHPTVQDEIARKAYRLAISRKGTLWFASERPQKRLLRGTRQHLITQVVCEWPDGAVQEEDEQGIVLDLPEGADIRIAAVEVLPLLARLTAAEGRQVVREMAYGLQVGQQGRLRLMPQMAAGEGNDGLRGKVSAAVLA